MENKVSIFFFTLEIRFFGEDSKVETPSLFVNWVSSSEETMMGYRDNLLQRK